MELKSRNVQHARNLFDRAVTLLPRVDQLWYKYVYLEELLQNVPGARQVFERWMQWEPDDKAWQAYIKLEERYQELDRSSAIYERWVAVRPEPRVWVKWGKFEEDRGRVDKAREVFQTALEFYGDDEEQVEKAQAVFNAFAKMETRLKEYERARVIYKVRLLLALIYLSPDFFPTVCTVPHSASKICGSVCRLYKIRKTARNTKYARKHRPRKTSDPI
jgi:crooked neck